MCLALLSRSIPIVTFRGWLFTNLNCKNNSGTSFCARFVLRDVFADSPLARNGQAPTVGNANTPSCFPHFTKYSVSRDCPNQWCYVIPSLPLPQPFHTYAEAGLKISFCYFPFSGFGGLEVTCWPLVPKFAGSNPAEAVEFLRVNKNPQHVGGHGCSSVVIVVCCQVEVIQRDPTDCGASLCVIQKPRKNKLNRRRITGCISYKPLIVT